MQPDQILTRRRQRALIDSLNAGGLLTATKLSETHRVSTRTIYRDVADLQRAGVPIQSQAGMGYMLRRPIPIPSFLQEDPAVPHRNDPPTIPLDALEWMPTGDDADPKARLLAHIRIGGLDMHLEAWEIEYEDADGINLQCAKVESRRSDDFNSLCNTMDCSFETIAIEGREYVLVAVPYGR